MSAAQVLVIGGGASGLSSAAALARRGIDAVVLEQDAGIGGTWARRYDRLRLHTMRQFSGLAHWPIPRRYPRYLSRDHVVDYLREYANHFGLRICGGTTVRRIQSDGDRWIVETDADTWRALVVVIATGQYREPIIPTWPGRTEYRGRLVHSVEYRNAASFQNQRVLVVGAGNSGAEIATDLVDHGAAAVAISIRTPPPIVPRDPFGMPVQRTSLLLSALPAAVANGIGRTTARLALGDLTRYGMPHTDFNPYTTRRVPLIDVGFVDVLKRGRLAIRAAVEALTETGAAFADGSRGTFDAVVAATGFATGLETMLDAAGVLDDHGEPLSVDGRATAAPGLFFVGFTHSLRGHLFEANRASRRLAAHVKHYLTSAGGCAARASSR